MTKKEELKEKIKQAEQLVDNLKSDLEKLEKEPEFKQVNLGEPFYTIETDSGTIMPSRYIESNSVFDYMCFHCNNYFHTMQRVQKVLNKIDFLLKMERLHDIYCPDYKPDWKDIGYKYFICYSVDENKFIPDWRISHKDVLASYFPNRETAQTVCNKLNEELQNKKG